MLGVRLLMRVGRVMRAGRAHDHDDGVDGGDVDMYKC